MSSQPKLKIKFTILNCIEKFLSKSKFKNSLNGYIRNARCQNGLCLLAQNYDKVFLFNNAESYFSLLKNPRLKVLLGTIFLKTILSEKKLSHKR
jgi:hypothetical protein